MYDELLELIYAHCAERPRGIERVIERKPGENVGTWIPVCGMNVEAGKSAAKVSTAEKWYYFCAPGCAKRFPTGSEEICARSPAANNASRAGEFTERGPSGEGARGRARSRKVPNTSIQRFGLASRSQ